MGDKAETAKSDSVLPADWIDDHADALYRFALTKVSDPHVVEDLLQETYLAACAAQHRFRGDSATRTWLVAILRLKIVDYYRAQARDVRALAEVAHRAKRSTFREEALAVWDLDPTASLQNQEFWETFQSCVDKLPDLLLHAFLLRDVDDLPTAEVCALLGITNRNLAVRIFRARSAIRDCLDENWFCRD